MPRTLGDYFTEYAGKADQYLGSDRAMAELPMLGAAVRGTHQDDPLAMINRVLSGIGQSTIASKKATEQEAQNKQLMALLMKYLGGGGSETGGQAVPAGFDSSQIRSPGAGIGPRARLTDKNLRGPTGTITKENADGTYSETTTGRRSDIGQPVRAPQQRDPNLLPLLLAQSGTGASGSSLAGLSPEQILGFMTRGNVAQQVGNQTFSSIYDALQKSAYADYLGRMPQGRAGVDIVNYKGYNIRRQDLPGMIKILEHPETAFIKADKDTGTYKVVDKQGGVKDTEIVAPEKDTTHRPFAPTAAMKDRERTFTTDRGPEVWSIDADGKKKDFVRHQEMKETDFFVGLEKIEGNQDKSRFWNRNVKGSDTTGWAYEYGAWSDTSERFALPLYKGEQMDMRRVRKIARIEQKTVDEIILEIYKEVKKQVNK